MSLDVWGGAPRLRIPVTIRSGLPVNSPLGYTCTEERMPGGVMVTLRILVPPFLVRVQAG